VKATAVPSAGGAPEEVITDLSIKN
jgi:hypothetical protein